MINFVKVGGGLFDVIRAEIHTLSDKNFGCKTFVWIFRLEIVFR